MILARGRQGRITTRIGRAGGQGCSSTCRAPARRRRTPAPLRRRRVPRATRDLEQVHLVLGLPASATPIPTTTPPAVSSTLLGGGMSSRLFQEIREKRGLGLQHPLLRLLLRDGGLFGIYAGTGEDEVAELVPLVCDES